MHQKSSVIFLDHKGTLLFNRPFQGDKVIIFMSVQNMKNLLQMQGIGLWGVVKGADRPAGGSDGHCAGTDLVSAGQVNDIDQIVLILLLFQPLHLLKVKFSQAFLHRARSLRTRKSAFEYESPGATGIS